MSYTLGSRVRVRTGDPDHHTRVPRYVRGHTGVIIAALGHWPVPDDSARGSTRRGSRPVTRSAFPPPTCGGAATTP